MTVEAIQDLVEMELMKSSRKDVAQKYIAYRKDVYKRQHLPLALASPQLRA